MASKSEVPVRKIKTFDIIVRQKKESEEEKKEKEKEPKKLNEEG